MSSHGFSEYQLCLWKYPSMAKIKELRGHTARVLHLDQARYDARICCLLFVVCWFVVSFSFVDGVSCTSTSWALVCLVCWWCLFRVIC